jgi:hypothetical protein
LIAQKICPYSDLATSSIKLAFLFPPLCPSLCVRNFSVELPGSFHFLCPRPKQAAFIDETTKTRYFLFVPSAKAPKTAPGGGIPTTLDSSKVSRAGRVLKHRAESHAGRVREIHLDLTRSGRDVIITWPYHFFSCRCSSHFIYDICAARGDKTGVRLIEK